MQFARGYTTVYSARGKVFRGPPPGIIFVTVLTTNSVDLLLLSLMHNSTLILNMNRIQLSSLFPFRAKHTLGSAAAGRQEVNRATCIISITTLKMITTFSILEKIHRLLVKILTKVAMHTKISHF